MSDAPAPPATVLVIDDDPGLRMLFATALRRAGYATLEAADGEEGLALVHTAAVGLVLCDVTMPGMDGYAVVRALRASPDTATLPVVLITGTAADDAVIEGLAAGADDFLGKPVRLDELVARVKAHIRTRSAWLDVVQDELHARLGVAATLARLRPGSDPEDTARVIVAELAERPEIAFVAVFQVEPGRRGRILATSLAPGGDLAAAAPSMRRMRYLIDRATAGPWVEDIVGPEPGELSNRFWSSGFDVIAGAPIFWNERLVGILTMGRNREPGQASPSRVRDLLLATVIDYAAVLGATVGHSLSARSDLRGEERRLRRILAHQELDVVFQPIVELETLRVIGYEALTRFDDGVPPDVRFAEAWAAGVGVEFELAAVALAAKRAATLPSTMLLALNLSPDVVLSAADRLVRTLPVGRPVVLEITEHVPVRDYRALRDAIGGLGGAHSAVDDMGAGFASMRHVLELKPAFAKMDMSLIRGIHEDELRQGLAAGLVYYGLRSGFRLIAEGVEEEAEATKLRELGVELGQGYLFGRPAPLSS
ncbi:MAG TPA: EAL domain-containing protein [Candidatus Limnocylindrales bacterium]|nr:EAL domain-containing protein [Candidatus Limnocylindrales bacterium]